MTESKDIKEYKISYDFKRGRDRVLEEGERIIKMFFDNEGIRNRCQVYVYNLKFDTSSYRVPDFYLPRYKMFVEFKGKWRDKEQNIEYKIKEEVYRRNKIPCVLLYPDNLGTLEYIFHYRILKELHENEMTYRLFLYRLDRYFKYFKYVLGKDIIIGVIVGVLNMMIVDKENEPTVDVIQFALLVVIGIDLISLITGVRKYFFKDN